MSDGSPRWKKLVRYPLHGWQTFTSVSRIFKANRGADVAFFPSVSTHHLLGLVPLLLIRAKRLPGKIILFFQCTPILPDQAEGGARLNPEATARLFPILVRLLRPLVASGRVILGVETEAMRAALTKLCGMPFVYFPHPVEFHAADAKQASPGVLLGCYGTTRYEKGNDLFQVAAKEYLQRESDGSVRFVMHWTENFHAESGKLVTMDPYLVKHPQVDFITEFFAPDGGYMRQVAKTGIMVLPYRDSYVFRLSRVVIEAMLAGVPVIVPENTTLAKQALAHGAAVSFRHEDPDGLVQAIEEAVEGYGSLRQKARRLAPSVAQHFSVARFRDTLLAQG